MNAIKSGVKEVWRSMYFGFFAMLPGLMFVGLLMLIGTVLGIDDEKYMIPIMLFCGACGGVWTSKKVILIKIERMSDQTTKLDVYAKVKSG